MASAGRFAFCSLPSVVTRADDVAGAWVAECVPLGVITQGNSLEHALAMLVEAVDMVIDDDLARGVDPLKTRVPLPGSADDLAALMSRPLHPVDVGHVDDAVSTVVVLVEVVRPHVPAMQTGSAPEIAKSHYTSIGSPVASAA